MITRDRIADYISSMRGKIINTKRKPIATRWQSMLLDHDMSQPTLQTENIYIIEIPEKELEYITEMRDWYARNIGGYDMEKFDNIIKDDIREKRLRETDPRLKQLYEQYKIMLTLIDDKQYNSN